MNPQTDLSPIPETRGHIDWGRIGKLTPDQQLIAVKAWLSVHQPTDTGYAGAKRWVGRRTRQDAVADRAAERAADHAALRMVAPDLADLEELADNKGLRAAHREFLKTYRKLDTERTQPVPEGPKGDPTKTIVITVDPDFRPGSS